MWMEASALGFGIGIAASAHCAGMCGVFALRAGTGGERAPLRMGLYLGGKTFTYVFLGALAGLAGASVSEMISGIGPWLGLSVAAILLHAGWRLLRPVGTTAQRGLLGWVTRTIAPLYALIRSAEEVGGPFALGAATGLLPCGVVYAAAAQGAAFGSPLAGAVLMAAFGLGTLPVLAAIGLLGRGAIVRMGRDRIRMAGAAVLLVAGVAAAYRAVLPLLADPAAGGAVCCH